MRCDDGHYYVVKSKNNPQHRRVPVNDYIGTRIAGLIGLPVAEPAVVYVAPPLASAIHFDHEQTNLRQTFEAGLSFGSRYVIKPWEGLILDYVPSELTHRIRNLRDFFGILAFDKWTCNADGRQAVYWRYSRQKLLTATFIDHGFCFNAGEWNFPDAPLRGVYGRNDVYSQVTGWPDFEPWLSRIESLSERVLWETLAEIPVEWYAGAEQEIATMLHKLFLRRSRVRELIWGFARSSRNPFPRWKESIC